ATARRFEVALKPDSTETLKVVEETVMDQTDSVSNLSSDHIISMIKTRNLNEKGRTALQQIADKKRAIGEGGQELAAVERQLKDLSEDQTRLRENIKSLTNVPGQSESVQRYSRQLSEGEVKITALRDSQSTIRKQQIQLQSELNALIENL